MTIIYQYKIKKKIYIYKLESTKEKWAKIQIYNEKRGTIVIVIEQTNEIIIIIIIRAKHVFCLFLISINMKVHIWKY